jgi:hypothetical protein
MPDRGRPQSEKPDFEFVVRVEGRAFLGELGAVVCGPVSACLFLSSVPNYLIYVSAYLVSLPWVNYSMLPLSEMPHFHHENITDSSTAAFAQIYKNK